VTGNVGTEPKVKIDTPLKVKKTTTQVLKAGHGNPVVANKKALLHIYLANGRTGKKAATTYDQGQPAALTMSKDQLFPAVIDGIVGKPAGSRVAVAASVKDVYGAAGATQLGLKPADDVLFVVDIMSVEPKTVLKAPKGTQVAPPKGVPTVVEKSGKVTGLDFSKAVQEAKVSKKLQVIPLVKGDGPPARATSLVTFNYFGEVYGAKKPFDESYSKQPVTFGLGVGGLIKGWDQGLVGVKAGSRVMIIAPPDYGYGAAGNPQGGIKKNATLVFIVDILGVDG
jgi:peptidylprolyl isomerase